MNFTRDPIIETIITPKEGYKLALRNSKGGNTEEFFVDSVQVITLGQECFYRSFEKPKPFILPTSDYEILEVRETRVALKLPGIEKGGIKIAGGRESNLKSPQKEQKEEGIAEAAESPSPAAESRGRKDKRRFKKRRERLEKEIEEELPFPQEEAVKEEREEINKEEPRREEIRKEGMLPKEERSNYILPPPSTLISETISKYKDSFASAFFEKEKAKEPSEEQASDLPVMEVTAEESPEDERLF